MVLTTATSLRRLLKPHAVGRCSQCACLHSPSRLWAAVQLAKLSSHSLSSCNPPAILRVSDVFVLGYRAGSQKLPVPPIYRQGLALNCPLLLLGGTALITVVTTACPASEWGEDTVHSADRAGGSSPYLLDKLLAKQQPPLSWGSSSSSTLCMQLFGCLVPSSLPPPPVLFFQCAAWPWKGEVVGEASYLPV